MFALGNAKGSEIFVPKIPSYKIIDIAKAINPKNKIKIVGIRPGEKIHEEMITESDSYTTFDLGNCYAIVNPSNETVLKYYTKNKKFKKVPENFSYSSGKNTDNLTVNQLKNLINKLQMKKPWKVLNKPKYKNIKECLADLKKNLSLSFFEHVYL